MSDASLQAIDVHKVYGGEVAALTHIDLQVSRGETMALVGESGSGKSTLLRLFNRLEEPTRGTVHIHGRPAREHEPFELRRQIGYVPQEGGLLPHWTVERNVSLVLELNGLDAPKRREISDGWLDQMGLDPSVYRDRYPRQLSGGQRQRVAVARALAADPKVVLLDEPFSALDPLIRAELQSQFLDLKKRLGKTMVLVTHDLAEAFRLADRIAVMRSGRTLRVGSPSELQDQPGDPYVQALLDAS